MCYYKNCKIKPIFNYENEKIAKFCKIHKLVNMIDIINKKCAESGCTKQPTYNYENEKKGLYCKLHKLENMIDIKHKTCIYENCKTRPCYNFENETKALYCFIHKKDNMIDIVHKKCKYENCKIQPTYNFENEKKGLYCKLHKLENMIDIKHKTCIYENCKTRPCYNFENERLPKFCFEHKLLGMIDIISRTCIHENCKIQPNYNFSNETKPIYCSIHKLENMVDIRHQMCKTLMCNTRVEDKYEGYCLYCFIHMFPEKPVARNYKTKEFAIVEYIKSKFPNLSWISDKIVNNGCSKRRPDILLDLGYQVIIVEVDENQHNKYDTTCENKRIMEISQDLDYRPIIFIRFNPDDYMDNKKNITSCWAINKNGICSIKKSKKKEWLERLTTLEQNIEYWINPVNIINKTIEIIRLFYDK